MAKEPPANVINVMLIPFNFKEHHLEIAKVSTRELLMLKMIIQSGGGHAQIVEGLLSTKKASGLSQKLNSMI